ncbi:MAG: BamA/TamA family outer membrane protein [Verrucomicrobiota bacterium JB024]|nr:BamA/TamA family outer membrane protein [Verrucomicrobiota bacterium JB024]
MLVSVGAGLTIRTIVGPLRFEYGYNVKKRDIDPRGTFQVALGFPF